MFKFDVITEQYKRFLEFFLRLKRNLSLKNWNWLWTMIDLPSICCSDRSSGSDLLNDIKPI